ncbi:MAG TPA: AI-2E family transporter [Candidatus Subteraquimicrobiales bacterium]
MTEKIIIPKNNNDEEGQAHNRYRQIATVSWAILGVIAIISIVLFLVYQFRAIFSLFVYSFVIVYVLRPVVGFLESKKIPRVLAVLLTYFLFVLVLAALLIYFIPLIINQIQEFVAEFPRYLKATVNLSQGYLDRLKHLRVPSEASKFLEQGLNSLKNVLLKIISKVPGVTLDLITTFIYFLLAPVLAFYILKDLKPIKENLMGLVPRRYREETNDIITKVDLVLGGFVKGQLLVALIVGVLSSIGLSIIGVNFSVLIGMITGVLNVVPYLGPIAGAILAALVAVFESPILALEAVGLLLVIQQIDGLFISPHVVGSQVNLHPVVIIFSLLMGGAIFGVLGMILAIPVAATIKALILHFQEKSLASENP